MQCSNFLTLLRYNEEKVKKKRKSKNDIYLCNNFFYFMRCMQWVDIFQIIKFDAVCKKCMPWEMSSTFNIQLICMQLVTLIYML